MSLKQQILDALKNEANHRIPYVTISKMSDNALEIEIGSEYDSPTVGFSNLVKLSQIFGTEKIDIDDYCHSEGCDTCGNGSDYGKTIQIYEITKNYYGALELGKQTLHVE